MLCCGERHVIQEKARSTATVSAEALERLPPIFREIIEYGCLCCCPRAPRGPRFVCGRLHGRECGHVSLRFKCQKVLKRGSASHILLGRFRRNRSCCPVRLTRRADYMTEDECARELGRKRRTLRRWRLARVGPAVTTLGGQKLYRRAAVAEWLLSQEQPMIRQRKR
jgi:hypothetical protein